MNIKTIKNLIVTSAIALVLISTHSALAYVPGVWDPSPRVNPKEPAFFVVPTTVDEPPYQYRATTPVAVTNAPAPTRVATTRPTHTTTVARATTKPRIVYVASNTEAMSERSTQSSTMPYNQSQFPPAQTVNTNPQWNGTPANTQAAMAVKTSSGFMPSTILGWFLTILLIIAVIVIVRTMIRSDRHDLQENHAH